jgi:HEPN domain-containing protein
MPIATLNRNKLRQLCESRLEEARVLLDRQLWTGAYYLTGLAIECALKSCLAGAVKEHDFPDKRFVNQMYVHNLEQLFKLNGALWAQLQAEMAVDAKLAVNWTTIKDWDDERRYDVVEELVAKGFYVAATEAGSGILEWIRRRW